MKICTRTKGGNAIISGEPNALVCEDVLFVPKAVDVIPDIDKHWGVYDRQGLRVTSAATRRGGETIGGARRTSLDMADISFAPDLDYVYGGYANGHYGHFLLSTLSRLWQAPFESQSKIVFHLDVDPDVYLTSYPFAAEIFAVMGISIGDIVRFEKPVRFRRLRVPEPAFIEEERAFTAFRTLCRRIGLQLSRDVKRRPRRGPAYFSKSALNHGVWRIVGEEALAERLSEAGFDIVFPEQLSLAEQIAEFEDRSLIIAPVGSALHTAIFSNHCCPVIAYTADDYVLSNLRMIDRLAGARVAYVRDPNLIGSRPGRGGFHIDILLRDPVRLADGLLRFSDSFKSGADPGGLLGWLGLRRGC